jgi:hypothetical protein
MQTVTGLVRITTGVLLAVFAATLPLRAQSIPLTERIARLDGFWRRDFTKGIENTCGGLVDPSILIRVSASEVSISSGQLSGVVKLDGGTTTLFDGRAASASLDAGWLAVSMRRQRREDRTNVTRDVYIVRDDELTVWRSFHVELSDGTQGKIDCGNRQAIVYQRQK